MNSKLAYLPPKVNLESMEVLKKLNSANRYLAELKGISGTLPNQDLLINTLFLQEAKDSSAIENIITTNDELFKNSLFPDYLVDASTKEVQNYKNALQAGYELIQTNNLLTSNIMIEIQSHLEKNPGFRTMPGTVLMNKNHEVIYTPPQEGKEMIDLMINLERFMNDDDFYHADPLLKMTIIHFQFESIHPFYDGNGRTGRIINILYLAMKGLLKTPILYLSHYIIQTKDQYYRLFQKMYSENSWEEWVLYMLEGVESTSHRTTNMIQAIHEAYVEYQDRIREKFKFFSNELVNNIFMHPYTKIDLLMHDLNVSRITATHYLEALTEGKFLRKEKIGIYNYYINTALMKILTYS